MSNLLNVPLDHPFSIDNIPFGVYADASAGKARCATRLGDHVIDLQQLVEAGLLQGAASETFNEPKLNAFAALPHADRKRAREQIRSLLLKSSPFDQDEALKAKAIKPVNDVKMLLPVSVGGYTDFCASEYHTLNAGRLMKVGGPPLPPAWPHMPVGYAGRTSSIIVSGTAIHRPKGMLPPSPSNPQPSFGPEKALDMEFEMAAIVGGPGNQMGDSFGPDETLENIFGLVIMNDWSARSIQGFEMAPLGPFNGKNFATTISPWIVTLDALEPFKTTLPPREIQVDLASIYTHKDAKPTYDIQLEMSLKPSDSTPTSIMSSNLRHLAYSFGQMLAHSTSSGCPLQAGDMMGSGTISGPEPGSLACLLEICERGSKPLQLGGAQRTWLEDGDEVVMKAIAPGRDGRGSVGFGECTGKILPAK